MRGSCFDKAENSERVYKPLHATEKLIRNRPWVDGSIIYLNIWSLSRFGTFFTSNRPLPKNIRNIQSNDKNAPLLIYNFRYNDSTAENVKDFDIWFNSKILV